MKKISLTKGKFALVDNKDFEWLNQWKWCFSGKYAHRMDKNKKVYMHRLILNTPIGLQTDHINHNLLDNRRKNLRVANQSQNSMNRKKTNNKYGYKGIYFDRTNKKHWITRLKLDGKYIRIGSYITKEEAAQAYNRAAIIYFGAFAKLNKI